MILADANKAMLHIFGHDASIIGLPIMEAIPELQKTPLKEHYRNVLHTGQPHEERAAPLEMPRDGVLQPGYYDYTYTPLLDAAGKPYGVNCTVVEVSGRVETQQKFEESEAFNRDIIHHSPVAKVVLTGEDLRIHTVNENMLNMLGRDARILGMPLMEAVPELQGTPLRGRLLEVLHTGETFYQPEEPIALLKEGRLQTGYYNYIYKALFNTAGAIWGIMVTAHDITEQVQARKAAEVSELRFRRLIEEAPVASCLFTGEDMVVEVANKIMLGYWGRGPEALGKPLLQALPELRGQGFMELLQNVYHTGETYTAIDAEVQLEVDGVLGTYYFDFTYKALRDENGFIYGVMDTAVDVTEKVRARRQKEAAERRLLHAIEIAELGTWSLDVPTGIITYSQRLQDWMGIAELRVDLTAPADALPADAPQSFHDLKAALDPEGSGLFDKVYTIAHRQTGRRRTLRANGQVLFNAEGQAVSISGTAQDITAQQQRQSALEAEVQERTEELAAAIEELRATNEELGQSNTQLQHSNEELAQYAYVASHDLQEPLRKIRIFTDMLAGTPDLPPAGKVTVQKISQSAERMSLLIQDLLAFSRLLKSDQLMRPLDLHNIVQAVWSDYELKVSELSATLEVGTLPRIEGVSLQINQLFYNLMGNALKFVTPGVAPHIGIHATAATPELLKQYLEQPLPFTPYHHLTFTDNGIGFDTEYAEQIFEVFKRLHGRDMYPGSGIGLALCRRIAGNHHGVLWAESKPGAGTTFHMLLPERQHQTVSEFGTDFDFPKS